MPLLGPVATPAAAATVAGVSWGVRMVARWPDGVSIVGGGGSGGPVARLAAFAESLLLRRCVVAR